jgi:uncharacterized membrane protein YfhO
VNEIDVKVQSMQPSLLVLMQMYSPLWQVSVNGRSGNIRKVNKSMMAVEIPAGESTVQFTFRPKSIYVSFFLGLASILVILFILIKKERQVLIAGKDPLSNTADHKNKTNA